MDHTPAPPAELDDEYDDEVLVCPAHLRFVPCRRCPPGVEQFSSDPDDVARTLAYQQGPPD